MPPRDEHDRNVGATEWIWKGEPRGGRKASLFVRAAGQRLPPRADGKTTNVDDWIEKPDDYFVEFRDRESTFEFLSESFGRPSPEYSDVSKSLSPASAILN
jgi:hypothetical protein